MNDPYAPGTPVIVWGRPDDKLILLFGEGHYEGTTFFNGNYWPSVRLNSGREITVHQQGIAIGRTADVANTCKRFAGDVIEWDLDAYLRGERPSVEQRLKSGMTANGSNVAMPAPKTASDKVMLLKREIDLEENKKKLAAKMIEGCDVAIAAKKAEIQQLTQAVLNELVAVNPDIIRLVTEQVAAQLAAAQKPIVDVPVAPGAVIVTRVTEPINVDEDHAKLAVED